MRQRRWLELLKDYDCEILYHPGKANVVAGAMSRQEKEKPQPLYVKAYQLIMSSDLMKQISEAQTEGMKEEHIKAERMVAQEETLLEDARGVKTRYGRIWVPLYGDLRKKVMDEAHKSHYSIHPGTNKMYLDLKRDYWWPNIKFDITRYVGRCLTCAQVKTEHQKPYGRIQPLDIPEWK
jgi:hypothetical protein